MRALPPFWGGGAGSPSNTKLPGLRPTSIPKVKVKVKVGFLYSVTYMVDQEERALTISEVAVDLQEPIANGAMPALTDIGSAVAASMTPPPQSTTPGLHPVSIHQ